MTVPPPDTDRPAPPPRDRRTPERPLGQLAPQPWMEDPGLRAVLAALTADGTTVRFVGGCVRDSIANRPVKDIDLATPDPPERVMGLLRRAGLQAIPTGIGHGTVTAIAGGRPFEITTLRRDVTCDGRHAEVAFTDDWVADAARRDFTFNALSADPSGTIYDPFDGLRDLGAGRVRFVGSPRQRLEEDRLRLLRFFRFHAWYGRGAPDRAAVAACRVMAPGLDQLSAERVRGELIRILLAPDPASVLLLMQGEQILPRILPEARDFGRLRLMAWFETRGIRVAGIAPDAIRRLAALIGCTADEARALGRRLRLSNRETARLVGLMEVPRALAPDPAMTDSTLRRALQTVGAERYRDLLLLAWSARRAGPDRSTARESAAWLARVETAAAWQAIPFPLRGADVVDAGVPHGPRVGTILATLRQAWEDGDYRADRAALIERLHQLVGPG